MLAKVLGVAGFFLSMLALGWKVLTFLRTGVRVRVTLRPGLLDGTALHTVTRHSAKIDPRFQPVGRFTVEVAVIEVANRGRTSATLDNVGLDLGRGS